MSPSQEEALNFTAACVGLLAHRSVENGLPPDMLVTLQRIALRAGICIDPPRLAAGLTPAELAELAELEKEIERAELEKEIGRA